jgi:hypothetical protein
MKCPTCDGKGSVVIYSDSTIGVEHSIPCPCCAYAEWKATRLREERLKMATVIDRVAQAISEGIPWEPDEEADEPGWTWLRTEVVNLARRILAEEEA